jgi:endonuclease/exonuclease/phosphatase family metal-dependent hydrolase
MSLNVLHDHPDFENLAQRLDLIAAEIQRSDADIVCLQEVPWTLRLGSGARMLADRTGLNHVGVRANGNRWTILFEEGEAILSRYPLRDVAFNVLSPRAGFFEHRVVLRATADTPWGDVRVFVTHLTDGEEEINRGQAASLLAFVEAAGPGLAVVAGDFNAREESPQMRELVGRWLDTYRVAHPDPDDEGYTCCIDDLSAGPGEPLEKRIDYLFLVPEPGREARVVAMRRLVASRRVLDEPHPTASGYLWASDHVGLLTLIAMEHDPAMGAQW